MHILLFLFSLIVFLFVLCWFIHRIGLHDFEIEDENENEVSVEIEIP